MRGQFDRDPTQFFSVVGAPYVRERSEERPVHALRANATRPRLFEIGVATLFAVFCAVALAMPLFANSGAGKLVQLATHVIR